MHAPGCPRIGRVDTMYDLYTVKRTQIYLDEEQSEVLERRAKASGRTKSELIREAIDDYLAGPGDEGPALRRLKKAVKEAAGIAPYLPPGKEYVEELRGRGRERWEELERRWHG